MLSVAGIRRDPSLVDVLASVVAPYINMFRLLVALRRECECHRRGVVHERHGGERLVQTYLPKKRMQPQFLLCPRNRHVLHLSR